MPYKSRLFRRKDTLVRRDVFVRLDPDALAMFREATERRLAELQEP
jgi:hypothetical protein